MLLAMARCTCSAANVQSDLKQPLCIYIPRLRGGLQSVQSYICLVFRTSKRNIPAHLTDPTKDRC